IDDGFGGMLFTDKTGDLLVIDTYVEEKYIRTFTRSSGYRDVKLAGYVKPGRMYSMRKEHNGILYMQSDNDNKTQGATIYSVETTTGKMTTALILEKNVCGEQLIIVDDITLAVVFGRCGEE